MNIRIAVIYYSATGNVHALAEALARGVASAGAEVRLRRVPELAPRSAIDSNPAWRDHCDATAHIEEATVDDLVWADGFAFGTPTRFGNVSSQLKQFLDMTGKIWQEGELTGKAATGFTSSYEVHGGQETTLVALYNVMHHWGSIIVPTGYADYDLIHAAGGNPYGISIRDGDEDLAKHVYAAAEYHGARFARIAGALKPLRAATA
ncbi:NAD(P)H:quinone oxidoreductase [Streptosporangium sp. NBC_01469]|uniref:NAD(P)H:quinone oxidoreductase n=1 Tax=Streptosporangium sp. NBC_01469 TaxID=2903898 RepID=UPI002E2D3F10|nr:NAD(P)H:quinone oxidoreductase [Streptosporangium sp. NBC_01469]